ncbi:unnamed protein product, partial [Prunus brigantina]
MPKRTKECQRKEQGKAMARQGKAKATQGNAKAKASQSQRKARQAQARQGQGKAKPKPARKQAGKAANAWQGKQRKNTKCRMGSLAKFRGKVKMERRGRDESKRRG